MSSKPPTTFELNTPTDFASRVRELAAARYKAVAPTTIRGWVDEAIANSRQRIRTLSEQFTTGQIDLPAWQTQVQAEIKSSHIAMAEVAAGGKSQFTPREAGRVGAKLRSEYKFLNDFALAIERGELSAAQVIARSELYAESARGTYEAANSDAHVDAGMNQERSVLGSADHCAECVFEAHKGWVEIGTLVPIGQRQCKSNCACMMEHRRSTKSDDQPTRFQQPPTQPQAGREIRAARSVTKSGGGRLSVVNK